MRDLGPYLTTNPQMPTTRAREERLRQEHLLAIGKKLITYKGQRYRRYKVRYSPSDKEYQKRTGNDRKFLCECGADWGQYRELGCDLEDCPICQGQLLSCGHGMLFETANARYR